MTGKKLKKTFRAIVMKAICFHGPELLHLFRPLVYVFIFVLGLSLFAADVAKAADNEQNQKPRLLVLTDIGDDPDDEQSMVRLLVYANAFEIEGFVTELWWKDTHKGRHGAMTSESQMKLLHHMLDLYGQVRPKLERHEKGYPQADALQKVIKRGKIGIQMTLSKPKGDPLQWIASGQDTEGSNWIIEVVDRDDPRPVDICIWGGSADLAQALLRVREERSPAEVDAFVSRIRVHAISDQDDTGPWIRENFPNLFYILDHDPNGDKWQSCYRGMFYGGDESLTSRAWIDEHVRHDHGPLGAFYPPKTGTNKNPHGALKEGDTPSWFYFYPNGLNVPAHPDYGGWGGRYAHNGRFWQDAADTVDGHTSGRVTVYRWRPSFQNDFAARMDRCVKDFHEANHAPVAKVQGDLQRHAKPGETVTLAATATDPDSDKLTYKWWQYADADSVDATVTIANSNSLHKASFVVPDESGKQIHIVLEVTDDGTPPLVGYQRVICNIGELVAQHTEESTTVKSGSPWDAVVKSEYIFKTAPFVSCHASTIAETKDGLVAAWFGGSRESAPDVGIWLSRHVNGKWTVPVEVANGQFGDNRYSTWNPVLFQPSQPTNAPLILFYKSGTSIPGWFGVMLTSDDAGKTWSEKRRLPDGILGPIKNKPIQLANGVILCGSSTEGDHGWRIHIERTSDLRQTWESTPPLNDGDVMGVIQPTLLTYPDGRIQILCRTRSEVKFIAESWSEDRGLTWSPVVKMVLPNNNSGLDGVTLADGRQLLVYNHSTRTQEGMGHKGRGILNVAVSRNGIVWEAALILDHLNERGKQFSYPGVIQTKDGLVHIVYTWHRQRIKHVVLDPARLVTTPMPDGEWPTDGPHSLSAFKTRLTGDRVVD